MKYRVELTKITSVHNNLPRQKYTGITNLLPRLEEHFGMWLTMPIRDENEDVLVTTLVKEITPVVDSDTGKKALIFKTKNSIYVLSYEEIKDESPIQESSAAKETNSSETPS